MIKSAAKRWLNYFRRNKTTTHQRRPSRRVTLELLESREAPATHIWTGGGGIANRNWSSSVNWTGGAPTGLRDGDGAFADLVFPSSASQRSTLNDLPTVSGLPTFKSISISAGDYTLDGNDIALGEPTAALNSSLNVGVGAQNNVIVFDVLLNGPAASKHFFTVNSAADVTLTGSLSSISGSSPDLSKQGFGTLILAADNSDFEGAISIETNGGVLNVQHVFALGNTSAGTTVGTNATLQVQDVVVTPEQSSIAESLILNGPGVANVGALLNVSGNNLWSGSIALDSNSTFGANAGTSLRITGQISDLGAGHDVTKEGPGQITFASANTYRGLTTVNDGRLTIQNDLALGAAGTAQNGTLVTRSLTKAGTLQLDAEPPDTGITVIDELLTINGAGVGGLGALASFRGRNNWAGDVILGSPAPSGSPASIGVSATSELIISGIIDDPNGAFTLTKVDTGRLIFNNANAYNSVTLVAQGALNIRDSNALGPGATTVIVNNGAALELEVDFNAPPPTWPGDPHGRDLTDDSVTGTNGNGPQLGLSIPRTLQITGTGLGGTGALRSISGINRWTGPIALAGGAAAIGVDADPNASNTNNYFTDDYSLTVTGDISGGQATTFRKVGLGHLILPDSNSYTGPTSIDQGWVTIRNNQSLGQPVGQVGVQFLGDTVMPTTTVVTGASLHLKPINAASTLNIVENLVLGGVGVVHPFALINQKGALLNLGGVNQIGGLTNGRSSDIKLNGVAGIGVENLGPGTVSELTITSSISDFGGTPGGISKFGSQRLNLQGDGTYSGANTVAEGVLTIQHDSALGVASTGTATGTGNNTYSQTTTTVNRGIAELQSLTVTGAAGTFTLTFNGQTTISLSSSATIVQVANALNALSTIGGVGGVVTVAKTANIYTVSFGGTLQGFNQPQLIATPTPGLFVVPATLMNGDGAALEMQSGVALNNGGLSGGLGIWYEALVLNSAGNVAFGDGALTILSDDMLWRGPVSLADDATITVMPSARITLFENINDAADPTANGSNLTITGGGKVALTGNNSYRGTTFVNSGVLVLESGQALGSTGNADVQTVTLTGSALGTFTLTFNGQTTNALNFSATAAEVQTELNALSSIGGQGGTATVTRAGNVLTVTFGGKFFAFNQPLMVAAGFGGTVATPATSLDGAGATIVANGAALELQGSITVGGESLLIEGQGAAQTSNIPEEWFNIGPNPINGGQVTGGGAVTGRVTGVVADFSDSNVIYIGTAGGGVWKTKDGGKSWLPLFDLQDGSDEVQTVTVTGAGSFTLTFTDSAGISATTASVPTTASARDLQAALNSMFSIGGNDGSVVVTRTGNVFRVTFQGNMAGLNQLPMTATGPVTVATAADGIAADDVLYIGSIAMDPTDPRIIYIGTGETNNSTDSYYGTGIYRTTDSGKNWTRLDDATNGNPFAGKGIAKIIVDRGFNPNPANATTLFAAVGDGGVGQNERQQLRFGGFFIGQTFTLSFTGPDATGAVVTLTTGPITFMGNSIPLGQAAQTAANIAAALNGLANIGGIGGFVTVTTVGGFGGTRYIIQFGGALSFLNVQQLTGNPGPPPGSPSITISTIADGGNGRVYNGTSGGAGIWRFTGGNTWFNLTSVVSTNRASVPTQQDVPPTDEAFALANPGPPPNPNASGPNPPNSPGPDDDYRMYFPSTNATWSDVALIYTDISNTNNGSRSPVLYGALGTSIGDVNNAVFFTGVIGAGNPLNDTAALIWYVGDPTGSPFDNPAVVPDPGPPPVVDQRGGGFPRSQFAQWETDTNSFNPTASPFYGNIKIAAVAGATLITSTVYAVAATPQRTLNNIYRTTDGGKTWTATGLPANSATSNWDYANTILATNATTLFLGSYETSASTHVNHLFTSTDSGGTWTDISVNTGTGPHTADHALTRDSQGRLLVGTDGGLWRRETTGAWTNLNGNLGIAQINAVAGHPTSLKTAYAGVQSNGIAAFNNDLSWAYVDDKTAAQTFNSGGGQIRVDPENPQNVYYVELRRGGNSIIRRSQNGGLSWVTLNVNTFSAIAPLVLDPILPTRLLVGGTTLQVSFNQGATWTNLNVPLTSITEIAIASFQGPFQPDPIFTQTPDIGRNTYDPNTIYVTDGTTIYLTKNNGLTWDDRSSDLAGLGFIADLEVDPVNRDTVYAARNLTTGGVYQTTDAGLSWNDITYDLPNKIVWTVTLDPRSGDLYVGTDIGVYKLPAGQAHWRHFGNGLANTQVRDLELNLATNTMLAGTYGRGVYQLFLDNGAANAGALRAVSGTSIWTGPVYLGGDTYISAEGTQSLQNGLATASLTIVGTIQDAPGVAPVGNLTKIGQGDVILAGDNTYQGVTTVAQGVLIVQNPHALGFDPVTISPGGNTIVIAGTALELQSDLELEPITLNGDGILFNNHFQGALRNSANFNTYTGPLTLATNATIGVDSGSQLTIGSKTGLSGTGTIDDSGSNFTLTKELTGTLSLGGPNTYGGTTFVNQGALQVEHAQALGDDGGAVGVNGTLVRDGAQLQMHTPTTGAFNGVAVVVANESLSLSGTGIFGTGALYNTGGSNTWSGQILLDIQPGLAPDTAPPGVVAFGVSNAADALTVNPAAGLTETVATGVTKVGPGTLVFSTANNHTGTTYVNNGILNVRDSGALGNTAAFNEIQRVTVIAPLVGAGTFNLTFNGQTTGAIAFGATAATVQGALNGLSTIGGIGGAVTVTRIASGIDTPSGTRIWVYTVEFASAAPVNAVAGVNQNPMSGAGSTASTNVIVTTVADGSIGARVANGAALQVEGAGLNIDEALALNGLGVGGAGALLNVGGDNTWSNDVFFQTNTAIGANPATELTVSGLVQDPYIVSVPAGSFTKVGQGTVVFLNDNTYSGKTFINDGILNMQNSGSLGRDSETQTITLGGSPSGTFRLNFAGSNTGFLAFNSTATTVQNALNALPSIAPDTVSVVRHGNVFTVTFNGSLSVIGSQPLMTVSGTTGGTTAVVGSVWEVQTVTVLGPNGTFALRFNGQTTAALPLPPGAPGATAADLQAALEALSTIGVGNVLVTRSANVYTIVFAGSLAQANQNQLIPVVTGGATALVNTLSDGPESTLVNNGGTLQVQGNITVTSEDLTINGMGFAGGGALANTTGLNTWQRQIVLGSDSAIGATVGNATYPPSGFPLVGEVLFIDAAIVDNGNDFGVTKVGPGLVSFTGVASNTYTGLTVVSQGVLLQEKIGGALPFGGDLQIGDSTTDPDFSAVFASVIDDAIPDSTVVTVLKDGLLDMYSAGVFDTVDNITNLDGHINVGDGGLTVTNLTIVDGDVDTFNGFVDVINLDMTGGAITLGGPLGQLILSGDFFGGDADVVATSSANGPAILAGAGTVNMNGLDHFFTVDDGPQSIDLRVDGLVDGVGGETLFKDGPGLMQFSATGSYPGSSDILNGTLQVDGVIGDVSLDQLSATAILSGTGTVDNIFTLGGGIVSPGQSPGILNVAFDVFWDSNATFFIELNDDVIPGTDYDVLNVGGTVNIDGAVLDGNLGAGVAIGDSFTIITAGAVSNQFAQGLFAFIDGQKFDIVYNATSVVLTRVKNDATVTVVSSVNPSLYGQDVTFTAVVIPEANTGPIADGTPFVFHISGPGITGVYDFGTTLTNSMATLNPVSDGVLSLFGLVSLEVTSIGNEYQVTGEFPETADFNQAFSPTLLQTVRKADTEINLSSSQNPAVYGTTVTITADIHILPPGGAVNGSDDLTPGTVTFFVDGVPQAPAQSITNTTPGHGRATINLPPSLMTVGSHQIAATYSGDTHFKNANTVTNLNQVITKAATATTVVGAPNPSDPNQNVTFTVQVTSSFGIPAGTVVIKDGAAAFGNTLLDAAGFATFNITTLPPGQHTINVDYLGDPNYQTSSGSTIHIVRGFTAVDVASSLNPSIVNDLVTFTVTITGANPTTPTPTGTVSFYDGAPILANFLGSDTLDASGAATLDISSLSFGVHTINITYTGDGRYLPNSGSISQNVQGRTSVTPGAAPSPSNVGQQVTFTAQVSALAPASGIPTGGVEFREGATLLGTRALDGTGLATFDISTLSFGSHTIRMTYTGSSSFVTSFADIVQVVRGFTQSNVTSSLNPSHFGESVNFTATVIALAPASGTPTGSVDFFDGANLIGDNIALTAGAAVFPYALLDAAQHVITAHYNGATLFNESTGTLSPNQTVLPTNTVTTLSATPANPTLFGQAIDFRVEINTVAPGGGVIVGGTVDIMDGAAVIANDVPYNAPFIIVPISNLTVGVHNNITAVFNGTNNFVTSTSNVLSRQINRANTGTVLASAANPSVYGQTAFTATVSAVAPGGGIPQGSVTFSIAVSPNPPQTFTVNLNPAGTATITPNLSPGSYSISARYNGSSSYNFSVSNTINPQVVNKADTATAVSTSASPAPYGAFTVSATVSPVGPGAGTPTGQVTFHVTGGPSAGNYNAVMSGGIATLPVNLSANPTPYAITADYLGDANFNISNGSLAGGQQVNPANSMVTVSSSQNPSVFGQLVTFTATVNPQALTTGTVDFIIDGVTLGDDLPISNGQRSFQISTLSVGGSPHSIVVNFNGSNNFNPSTGSLSGGQVVNKANVVGGLTANQPALLGTTVNFNASFVAAAPGSGTPNGTADLFIDGVEVVSDRTLSGGAVSFNYNDPSVLDQGDHSVFVHYDGDPNFNAGNTNTTNQNIKGNVTVAVVSSNNPSVYGDQVTFTATIGPAGAAVGTPAGTADFIIDGVLVASNRPVNSGVATFQTGTINVNGSPHLVEVHYDGDTNFFEGTNSLPGGQTVTPAGTNTAVASSQNPSVFGQQVTFTASITRQTAGAGTPDGTADLFIDGIEVISNRPVAGGQATFNVSTIQVTGSPHAISVHYDGSANFTSSNGALAAGQTVIAATTTTTVTSSLNPSIAQQTVTFTAHVVAQAQSTAIPTGTVDFIIDGNSVASDVSLDAAGFATFATNSLGVGTHNVQVHYDGTTNLQPSDGNLSQVVNKNPVIFAVIPGSIKSGTPFSIVVQYRNAADTGPDPSFNGPVTLGIGNGPAGGGMAGNLTVNANGGVAVFTGLRIFKAGDYSLSANANGLPTVLSPLLSVTASSLALSILPAKQFVNQTLLISVTALDMTGGLATNYNGPLTITVVKRPAGARAIGPAFVNFNGGFAQITRKLNKAGIYTLRINGPNGLTATFRLTIRGRRVS